VDLPHRLVRDGATFVDQHVADFSDAPGDDVAHGQEKFFALTGYGLAPGLARPVRRIDGRQHFLRPGLMDARENLAGRRIEAIGKLVARRRDPTAVDKKLIGPYA